jgi:hypothetical protein
MTGLAMAPGCLEVGQKQLSIRSRFVFAPASAGRLGRRLDPFVVTLSFRNLRGWLLLSWRRRCPAGCVLRFGRAIFRVLLWPGRASCARIISYTNVFGAGLTAFVGRYGGAGVLGRDSSGTPVNGVVIWIAEGRIGVFVDGPGRAINFA